MGFSSLDWDWMCIIYETVRSPISINDKKYTKKEKLRIITNIHAKCLGTETLCIRSIKFDRWRAASACHSGFGKAG